MLHRRSGRLAGRTPQYKGNPEPTRLGKKKSKKTKKNSRDIYALSNKTKLLESEIGEIQDYLDGMEKQLDRCCSKSTKRKSSRSTGRTPQQKRQQQSKKYSSQKKKSSRRIPQGMTGRVIQLPKQTRGGSNSKNSPQKRQQVSIKKTPKRQSPTKKYKLAKKRGESWSVPQGPIRHRQLLRHPQQIFDWKDVKGFGSR